MSEPLDDLFKSFARDLRSADKAERTITIYGQAVRFFCQWLEQQGKPTTLDSLSKDNISGWLADLAKDHSTNTVATRHRGLRRFVRWLLAEEEITTDPMKNLQEPKAPSTPVPIVPDEDIAAMLKTCDGRTFIGRRDEAILRVLFDCGLRISEVAGLNVDDVDLDLEVLRVLGKGRKPRTAPFSAKTARALDRYLRLRRRHKLEEQRGLWLGKQGVLTVKGIDIVVKRHAEEAGVEGMHAHRFRHTFAHDWLAAGGQERDLMRLAGWSSDTMLDRYGASAAVERAHAAARKLRRGDRV